MSLRKGDSVQLKPGSKAQFVLRDAVTGGSGPLTDSYYIDQFRHGVLFDVTSPATDLGNIGVRNAVGLVASIHRSQLQRVFRGGYVEGDRVYIPVVKGYGTVVDSDPSAKEIDRAETVPVRIDSLPPTHGTALFIGAISYTEVEYLQPARAELVRTSVVALGGQGGAGGSANGVGAVGGQGGRGGSATVIGTGVHEAAEAVVEKPKVEPKYEDVTEKSTWRNLEVGDIVTAEHKTRHVGRQRIHYGSGAGAEVTVARTSEVTSTGGYGGKQWIELELGLSDYDSYKITKVLRLQKLKTVAERRRPIQLTVVRTVQPNHVWEHSYLRAAAAGYVERHQDGHYWLTFTDGNRPNGKKIRLKAGRDRVSYESIVGTQHVGDDYEKLVVATHDPE